MRMGKRRVYGSMRYLEIFEEHSFVFACNSWFGTSTEVIALLEMTKKKREIERQGQQCYD